MSQGSLGRDSAAAAELWGVQGKGEQEEQVGDREKRV